MIHGLLRQTPPTARLTPEGSVRAAKHDMVVSVDTPSTRALTPVLLYQIRDSPLGGAGVGGGGKGLLCADGGTSRLVADGQAGHRGVSDCAAHGSDALCALGRLVGVWVFGGGCGVVGVGRVATGQVKASELSRNPANTLRTSSQEGSDACRSRI